VAVEALRLHRAHQRALMAFACEHASLNAPD